VTVRRLTAADVTILVKALEDDTPPDHPSHDYDPEVVADFKQAIEEHGLWGWCQVRVSAVWPYTDEHDATSTVAGFAYLSGCSYENEEDFRQNSGYYDDLVEQALDELNNEIRHILLNASCIEKALNT
jgi:hypothetical protein